jgi:hypothetical protein
MKKGAAFQLARSAETDCTGYVPLNRLLDLRPTPIRVDLGSCDHDCEEIEGEARVSHERSIGQVTGYSRKKSQEK